MPTSEGPYGRQESTDELLRRILSGQTAMQSEMMGLRQSMESRMACAESAIAELKSSVSQVRECVDQLFATPAAATTGSSTTASSSVGDAEKFAPKAIIVKGWCADYDDFARDKSLGLSKKQAIELWAFLKESSNELKKHIGEAEIRGQQVFSFRIKILDGDAYEVIQAWRTLTASKEFPHVTGQELRFTPEASPVRQAENSRFGRLLGFVQAKAGKEFVMASWHPIGRWKS